MSSPHRIHVKVKPNAREDTLQAMDDGTWTAHLKAQPVDGKANAALIALVATHFKRHKRDVSIKSGAAARLKTLVLQPEK